MADLRSLVPNRAALARELGIDYSHIHNVLRGVTQAGPRLARRIEEATNGVIRAADLRPDLWPSQDPRQGTPLPDDPVKPRQQGLDAA